MISPRFTGLPAEAGIGLRSPHLRQIAEQRPSVGFLEVHAENYMDQSAAAAQLESIRGHFALSLHGVGLSLGSATPPDPGHLARLAEACRRYEPAQVSEHLSWSVGNGVYLNDLLPIPRDEEALRIVAANILRAQDCLKRPILIENVSAYVGLSASTMAEPQFLAELVARTGCGILLDINNVYVSAVNLGFDADAYIAALPGASIGEIHLAGHCRKETPDGPLLIDDHASAVSPDVWQLYAGAIRRFGPRSTLIEWDSDLPPLATLLGEAMWADCLTQSIAYDPPTTHKPGKEYAYV